MSYRGKYYYLTRLGFGLNCGPIIMSRILEVLSLTEVIAAGTDNYIDDILVCEDLVSAEVVASHLEAYGLQTKPAQRLDEGVKVLGLQ